MNDFSFILFNIAQSVPGFLMAIVVHEAAHAFVALKFGDDTAHSAGRLTLNPVAHYDPWGTILFPLIAAVSGWAVIGWAKPVPVNASRFRNIRKGMFWVSFAGPLSNFILGAFSAMMFAVIATTLSSDFPFYTAFLRMLKYSVFINFILCFFNLIPLPPLDGSQMLASFLNYNAMRKYEQIARFTPMIFLAIIALSIMGIPTLGYILSPAQQLGEKITLFFLALFS